MQDKVNVEIHQYDGKLIIQAASNTPDGSVVWETPELLAADASDEAIGRAVIISAERCRNDVNEPPSMAEDSAKKLGFKSWTEMQKKTVPTTVSRRKGAAEFKILPLRKYNKSGTSYVYTDTDFTAPITDAAAIGKAVRESLRLTAEWKLLPPMKF